MARLRRSRTCGARNLGQNSTARGWRVGTLGLSKDQGRLARSTCPVSRAAGAMAAKTEKAGEAMLTTPWVALPRTVGCGPLPLQANLFP